MFGAISLVALAAKNDLAMSLEGNHTHTLVDGYNGAAMGGLVLIGCKQTKTCIRSTTCEYICGSAWSD